MTDTNFLGMPVSGDIAQGSSRVDQKPIEELAPLFQALLDDPTIVEFGWSQYTPYFNDGDVCEFEANEPWVRTTAEVDTDEETFSEYDLDLCGHPSLGKVTGHWEGEWPNRTYVKDGYEGPDEARFERCKDLARALESGAFDNVLLKHFGDHARVTVRKAGIEVEFYEHD